MEKSNLIHREVFAEVPPRVEYSLTDTGWSLKPILDSMVQWGNNYREMQLILYSQEYVLHQPARHKCLYGLKEYFSVH